MLYFCVFVPEGPINGCRQDSKIFIQKYKKKNFQHQVIKVREAKGWQTRPGTPIKQQEYDWTWGTDYSGSCRLQDVGIGHKEVGG